jgi:hypothetical protein
MKTIDPSSELHLYRLVVRDLKRACLRSGLLPVGCFLTDEYYIFGNAISRSAYSDVYYGQGYGRQIAVKILRAHVDDRNKVWKVRACYISFNPTHYQRVDCPYRHI